MSLSDLYLAGVRWEISENMELSTTENTDVKKENSARKIYEPSIVPAVAPISFNTAEKVVKKVNNLSDLLSAIKDFEHPLRQFASNVVLPYIPAENYKNQLLIITDSPSKDDDSVGKILTGSAGNILDKMLTAININRDNISIIPLVFWHTPGGRTPTREELDLTKPFVDSLISMLKPIAVLTLGTLAADEVIKAKLPRNHGETFELTDGTSVIPIYHPNYMVLKPDTKKDVWAALQKLQNLLKTSQI
ncbi:MAG TPA: uracil-DNA glycosylase [Alphaproteobacteria bacterium]|nr:uracil-DNA glycosylase [Alphaproteobacteria bacterium]